MGYFPFFMDIGEKRCLIAGGGPLALRKAQDLLPFGPLIHVIAPDIVEGFSELAAAPEAVGRLSVSLRPLKEEDLAEADFVIAATSDRELNSRISRWCRERGVLVNVVDVREECSFIFPSLIHEGPVTVGISTGGASPALAARLRRRIEEVLPEGIGALAELLASFRARIRREFPESAQIRGRVFARLADAGLESGCRLSEETAERMIKEEQEKQYDKTAADRKQEKPSGPVPGSTCGGADKECLSRIANGDCDSGYPGRPDKGPASP